MDLGSDERYISEPSHEVGNMNGMAAPKCGEGRWEMPENTKFLLPRERKEIFDRVLNGDRKVRLYSEFEEAQEFRRELFFNIKESWLSFGGPFKRYALSVRIDPITVNAEAVPAWLFGYSEQGELQLAQSLPAPEGSDFFATRPRFIALEKFPAKTEGNEVPPIIRLTDENLIAEVLNLADAMVGHMQRGLLKPASSPGRGGL